MSYVLIMVINLSVTMHDFDSIESCKFAGKSFMALTYGNGYKRDFKCVKK